MTPTHPAPIRGRWTGEYLRVELARRQMGQQALAEHLGYTQTAISYWATGKRRPSLDDLCALADVFGVTVDYLLGRAAPRPPVPDEAAIERAVDRVIEEFAPEGEDGERSASIARSIVEAVLRAALEPTDP